VNDLQRKKKFEVVCDLRREAKMQHDASHYASIICGFRLPNRQGLTRGRKSGELSKRHEAE
jgi:hypothetical protein